MGAADLIRRSNFAFIIFPRPLSKLMHFPILPTSRKSFISPLVKIKRENYRSIAETKEVACHSHAIPSNGGISSNKNVPVEIKASAISREIKYANGLVRSSLAECGA